MPNLALSQTTKSSWLPAHDIFAMTGNCQRWGGRLTAAWWL